MALMLKISLFALFATAYVTAYGQEFSTDTDYARFYSVHFDGKSNKEDTVAIWWLIVQFGNLERSREFLRDSLERHVKLYPDSEHAPLAKSHLATLKRMLLETRPPDGKRIDQLIFDFRDLNYKTLMRPLGRVNIVWIEPDLLQDYRKGDGSAVQQLVGIGYDCVPALIEHIDDSTLTRSVNSGRPSRFSDRVLTVGECCKQVLDAIVPSGRIFELNENPERTKEAMKVHYLHEISQAKKRAEQKTGP